MLGNTKLMENNSYGKINFEHVETTSKGSQVGTPVLAAIKIS